MPPVTHKITSDSERACLDSEGREPSPGTAARLERLEAARAGLWDALRIPGVEGQAGIFARLEDMQAALESLRRAGDAALELRGEGKERREENEIRHEEIAAAIRKCQETLRRMDQVFAFVGGLIEDRAGQANGGAYPFAPQGGGRRQQAHREGAGHWEG